MGDSQFIADASASLPILLDILDINITISIIAYVETAAIIWLSVKDDINAPIDIIAAQNSIKPIKQLTVSATGRLP